MKSLNLTNDHTLAKPQFCDSVWYATDNDQVYYFLKKPSYITVTYNVTKTGLNDILGNRTNGDKFDVSQVQSMSVDGGEEIEPSLSYNFTNTGTHTVRYKFNEGIVTLYKFLDKANAMNNNAIAISLDFSEFNVEEVSSLGVMFQTCSSLTSVGDLSNWNTSKVTAMLAMFYNCSSFTSVGDLSSWDISNVTAMDYMFSKCYRLKDPKITQNLTRLDKEMFMDCYSITHLDFGDNLKQIGQSGLEVTYNDCFPSLLESFSIPSTNSYFTCINNEMVLSKDGTKCYGGADYGIGMRYNAYEIPEGVTHMISGAFRNLGQNFIDDVDEIYEYSGRIIKTNISLDVTFPSTLTWIGDRVFQYSNAIKSLTVKAITPPTIYGNFLSNKTPDLKIYVPSESVNAYKTDANWKKFASMIYPIEA